jgi:hypothetical protein
VFHLGIDKVYIIVNNIYTPRIDNKNNNDLIFLPLIKELKVKQYII